MTEKIFVLDFSYIYILFFISSLFSNLTPNISFGSYFRAFHSMHNGKCVLDASGSLNVSQIMIEDGFKGI